MNFLLSNDRQNIYDNNFKIGGLNLHYNVNGVNGFRKDYLDYVVLGQSNVSFINKIYNLDAHNLTLQIQALVDSDLLNGYLILIDKGSNCLKIYSDKFGFYNVFYKVNGNEIIVSDSFTLIKNYSSKEVDTHSLLDLLLFNYILFNKTTLKDISKLDAGEIISIEQNGFHFEKSRDIVQEIQLQERPHKFSPHIFGEMLKSSLQDQLNPSLKNYLTITAGFDSRAILASSNNLGINFETLTFGQSGNVEQEIANMFIERYSSKHHFFKLDTSYSNLVPIALDKLLINMLDNPVIHDLLHYQYIFNKIESSNFVTGIMAGELFIGQSIGAQVTFTEFASKMIMSKNSNDLQRHFRRELKTLNILDTNFIESIEQDYLKSLSQYIGNNSQENLVRFLLYEKYAKFFGTINKLTNNKINLVNPFTSMDLIKYLLNSEISFLFKEPFDNGPISNFKAKIKYAKSIKYLDNSLGDTPFDRLYTLDDLSYIHRLPKAAWGYIKSHSFKINKKNYKRPHHYDLWYKDFVIDELSNRDNNIWGKYFNNGFHISPESYDNLTSIQKKRMASTAALLRSYELITH